MIRRIAGVRGAQAYFYRGAQGTAVIDPGYTGSYRAVLRFLQAHGEQPRALDWIILTHHHIDHAGTAFALAQATGAKLAIHRDDASYLGLGRPRDRMTLWGMANRLPRRLAQFVVSCADGDLTLLEDGNRIAGLTVIHAAGHTPGSTCLLAEEESTLFTGDVLNNERGIRTPPWTVNHSHRAAQSAPRRLLGLRYDRACFGHGPEIHEGADRLVGAFLANRSGGRSQPHPTVARPIVAQWSRADSSTPWKARKN